MPTIEFIFTIESLKKEIAALKQALEVSESDRWAAKEQLVGVKNQLTERDRLVEKLKEELADARNKTV